MLTGRDLVGVTCGAAALSAADGLARALAEATDGGAGTEGALGAVGDASGASWAIAPTRATAAAALRPPARRRPPAAACRRRRGRFVAPAGSGRVPRAAGATRSVVIARSFDLVIVVVVLAIVPAIVLVVVVHLVALAPVVVVDLVAARR